MESCKWSSAQADDFFKSDLVNPDRQLLNTDVGFLEMMRFKGALPEILNSRCVETLFSDCSSIHPA